ncbi:MAG: hypothetical protein JW959_06080 [Pirellulales bacterium]|nr:hypothetical protein [Pirellulales bacterium]
MNESNENNPADGARFDRLVDGQLSEQERRDLLASLDDKPGGWRHCALAFLEAQCWKQAFGATAPESESVAASTVETQPRPSPWPGRVATVLAMAASFLLALWVGWQVQQHRAGRFAEDGGAIAARDGIAAPESATPQKPWRMVNVNAPGRSLDLPAVERDKIDKNWLQNVPQAIPQRVREALARTGHDVKQRRELVPVSLDDGRKLIMPVDQVDVHYVGNGPY